MGRIINKGFTVLIWALALVAFLSLGFVMFFIVKEALPIFSETSLGELLFTSKWMPVDYGLPMGFGIFNFIMGTLSVSLLAMVFTSIIGLGASVFLSCAASQRVRDIIIPFVDLLAGVPSVVFGFVGIVVLLKLFMKAGVHTGSCVLAAAVLLSVMLLPFLVSSCTDTMLKAKERYLPAADALGIDKWYVVTTIVLPVSWKNILFAMVLAIGRAMGETMAVMMVMGNANLFPTLLGKGETISSLIALEMGTAVAGSPHYHALYAAGLVLLVLVFLINIVVMLLRSRLVKREGE